MPPYSGHTYKAILRPWILTQNVHLKPITSRDWESSPFTPFLPQYPKNHILGRVFNLQVELFSPNPTLEPELEALGYSVRLHDFVRPMSVYPGVSLAERNFVQVFQDILWRTVNEDEGSIDFALVAATDEEWVLVCRLQRELCVNDADERPYPKNITEDGKIYPIIGYFDDNEVVVVAKEEEISRFLIREPESKIVYRYVDRTPEGDIENTEKWWAMWRRKIHQKKKRQKRKTEEKEFEESIGEEAEENNQKNRRKDGRQSIDGKMEDKINTTHQASHETDKLSLKDKNIKIDPKHEPISEDNCNDKRQHINHEHKIVTIHDPNHKNNDSHLKNGHIKKTSTLKAQSNPLEAPKPKLAYAAIAAKPAPPLQPQESRQSYNILPPKTKDKDKIKQKIQEVREPEENIETLKDRQRNVEEKKEPKREECALHFDFGKTPTKAS